MAGMLSRANQAYQEAVGQPFVRGLGMVNDALRGYFGAPNYGPNPPSSAYTAGANAGFATEAVAAAALPPIALGAGVVTGLRRLAQPGRVVPAGQVNMFVGERGLANLKKTSPKQYANEKALLEQAKTADETGVFDSPAQSAEMYGWFKDKDGSWRKWVPDVGNTTFGDLNKSGMLGDVYRNPELTKWYPDIPTTAYRSIDDPATRWRGQYGTQDWKEPDSPGRVTTNAAHAKGKEREGVALHEIQHHIEGRESWEPGGSPRNFAALRSRLLEEEATHLEPATLYTLAGDLANVTGGKIPEKGTKEWRIAMEKLADLHNRNPGRYANLPTTDKVNGAVMDAFVDPRLGAIKSKVNDIGMSGKDLTRLGMMAKTQSTRAKRGWQFLDESYPSDDEAYKNLFGEYRARDPQRFWLAGVDPSPSQYTNVPANALILNNFLADLEKVSGVPRGTHSAIFGVRRFDE